MPDYNVQQGDCVWSIAKAAGLLPETVWNHPNNASLKAKRRDPNILYPGDIVFVPDLTVRDDPGATDQLHKFQIHGEKARLRLRLLDTWKPRANEKYTLEIDGAVKVSGQTDGDGWITQPIPSDAMVGKLLLNDGLECYTLNLGFLDPVEEISGVQGRLKNLGYYGGEIDGEMNDETVAALSGFQEKQKLEVTGEADAATQAALKAAHGS